MVRGAGAALPEWWVDAVGCRKTRRHGPWSDHPLQFLINQSRPLLPPASSAPGTWSSSCLQASIVALNSFQWPCLPYPSFFAYSTPASFPSSSFCPFLVLLTVVCLCSCTLFYIRLKGEQRSPRGAARISRWFGFHLPRTASCLLRLPHWLSNQTSPLWTLVSRQQTCDRFSFTTPTPWSANIYL